MNADIEKSRLRDHIIQQLLDIYAPENEPPSAVPYAGTARDSTVEALWKDLRDIEQNF